jgi:hypothetical protein
VGEPARLVDLTGDSVALPVYETLRDEARATAALAAQSDRSMSLLHGGVARMASGLVVSDNYFDVLQRAPALGRFFRAGENDSPEPVAVLGHGLWKGRFGGDPSASSAARSSSTAWPSR